MIRLAINNAEKHILKAFFMVGHKMAFKMAYGLQIGLHHGLFNWPSFWPPNTVVLLKWPSYWPPIWTEAALAFILALILASKMNNVFNPPSLQLGLHHYRHYY